MWNKRFKSNLFIVEELKHVFKGINVEVNTPNLNNKSAVWFSKCYIFHEMLTVTSQIPEVRLSLIRSFHCFDLFNFIMEEVFFTRVSAFQQTSRN